MAKLGKYEIIEEIGRGGFAVVYGATDTELGRDVALKVLHPQLTADPRFVERFKREAHTAARLDHPHIATVYDVGESSGQLYIAMELARGPSLANRIQEQGLLTWDEAMEILSQVSSALDYAHDQGFIHRDIKPSNILLDPDKGVLLSDFGLSKMIESSGYSLTAGGGMLGTPAYIAPEIWEGERPTPASDIYALGCVLYEMITGEVLFGSTSPLAVMKRHDEGPRLSETKVEAGFVPLLLNALERSPNDRYQRAGEFAAALQREHKRLKVVQEKVHQAQRAQEQATGIRKMPGWAWLVGGLVVLLLGSGGLLCKTTQQGQGLLAAFLITPTSTVIPTPTASSSATPTRTSVPTATLTPTTAPTVMTTRKPTSTAAPTQALPPTSTPMLISSPTSTATPAQALPPTNTPMLVSSPTSIVAPRVAGDTGVVSIGPLRACVSDECITVADQETYSRAFLDSGVWEFQIVNISQELVTADVFYMTVGGVVIFQCGSDVALQPSGQFVCRAHGSDLTAGITTFQPQGSQTRFGISPEVRFRSSFSGALYTPYIFYFLP